uniref:Vitellogenin n=1 Tax=Romanomermis culicivorax TaxID=13658 RepID=A0A915KV55_ROMCU
LWILEPAVYISLVKSDHLGQQTDTGQLSFKTKEECAKPVLFEISKITAPKWLALKRPNAEMAGAELSWTVTYAISVHITEGHTNRIQMEI